MRPARAWVFVPLLLLAIVLPSCGGDDEGSTEQNPTDLEGVNWIVTQMTTVGGQTEIVDVGVSAQFDGSTISGNSGCNQYHASYEAQGSNISFGPIAGTKKLCGDPADATETRYLQLLGDVGSFRISGRSMSMNDQSGTPVLQFSQG
ncbi:MAG TPA: META domain-containing protein [Actinomycetota bacterium]|nr:META domain-containing protein [Actinomycetota bacterium]